MAERAAVPVVALDGPSATGKGTLCVGLAARLGWHLLDSGAVYRAVALLAERRRIAADEPARLAGIAAELSMSQVLVAADRPPRVLLAGEDVSEAVRSEAIGELASRIAALPDVRRALLRLQRGFRRPPGLVADGRDMGTVVFPDAEVKLFITASPEERARRRYKQLNEKEIGVSLRQLLEDIKVRDERDRRRPVSPLMPADEAIIVDTTEYGAQEVLEQVLRIVQNRLPALPR